MKYLAIEGGGDWADASVVYLAVVRQFDAVSVRDTFDSLSWEQRKEYNFSLSNYFIAQGYCRELDESDELDVISEN